MRSMDMGTCQSGLPFGKPKTLEPQSGRAGTASAPKLRLRLVGLGCLIVSLLLFEPPEASAQPGPAGTFDTRTWLGPDGKTLPITTEDELLRFLDSASETSVKILSRGITGAKRLTLEQGGVEARVVFHDINRSEQRPKRLPNKRTVMYLRDSYKSQIAAYRLSRLLGMKNVPPTVVRVSGAATGSAQLWIEDAMTEDIRLEKGVELRDYNLRNQNLVDMWVFDNLINNIDRNQGNMLVDSFSTLWLIDHTRSFGQDNGLPLPEMITRCSNRMLQAIRSLDERTLRKDLGPYLTRVEIGALWQRRERVLDRLEELIGVQGKDQVLFDYGDPDPGVIIVEE